MTVSIIGTGNIAWHFITTFEEHEIRVAEIFTRKKKNAEHLQGYTYDVKVKIDLDFRNSESSIFILAVSDDAIAQVSSEILLPQNAILVHTSGAKPMHFLTAALNRNQNIAVGVFYPVMTFTKGIPVNFKHVPICIEGENQETENVLTKLAKKISKDVQIVNSDQRATLHVAAVFGSNFVNHLWALAKEIMEEEALDFEILKPLIQETFLKAIKSEHPAYVQTGPALRNDISTLTLHHKLIAEDDDLLNVYKTLTQSIQDWHQ